MPEAPNDGTAYARQSLGWSNTPAFSGVSVSTTGLGITAAVAASTTDLSKHIRVFSTTHGFNVTSARLNAVVPSGSSFYFVNNGVDVMRVDGTGALLPTNFAVNFFNTSNRILSLGVDGTSLANANLIVQSFNGIGFETSCVGQTIPVGLNSAIIASRTGQIISSGQLSIRDVTDNHVSNIGLLRIYQHTGVQYIEVVGSSYVPSLDPTTPIVSGGSGIAANDRFYDANNNTYTVLTVTAGAAATIRMDAFAAFTGTPPTNPIALTAAPGFAGTGLTVNLNWTPPTELNVRCSGITSLGIAGAPTNLYGNTVTVSGAMAHNGGISFGSVLAPGGATDLSKHIALFGTSYGLNVTSGVLNLVAGGAVAATFTAGGINGIIGGTTQNTGRFTSVSIDGAAGTQRSLMGRTGVSNRWIMLLGNVTPEGGSNAGSDFTLNRYTDAGAFIDAPLTVIRSTGIATFSQSPTAPTPTVGDSSTQLATTAFVGTAIAGGAAYVVVTDLTVSPPNVNSPVINKPTGLLVADTSVPDPSTQYLPIAGGTLTGNLTVAPVSGPAVAILNGVVAFNRQIVGQTSGSNRWNVTLGNPTAESGSNAGSDFAITRYSDAGAVIDAPLTITRSNGAVTVGGGTVGAFISINGAAATNRSLQFQTAGSNRWIALVSATAEGGSNAGSDFVIQRYTDAGTFIDNTLAITRSTGNATFSGGVSVLGTAIAVSNAAGATFQLTSPNGAAKQIVSYTGTVPSGAGTRWAMLIGTSASETGSNVGSDFQLNAYSDAGAYLYSPLIITRASGTITTSGRINTGTNYGCRAGAAGVLRANAFIVDYTGTAAQLWIDATNFGTFAFTSDYRTKKDVAPLPSMWERAKALKPISYRHKDYTPAGAAEPLILGDDKERWGFVAHELQDTLIEDAAHGSKDEENVIQSPNPWTVLAVLTKALQEAMARIEVLEAIR